MKKSKDIIKYKNIAEYHIRWETIYADKNILEEDLNKFKEKLKKDNYKVLHIIK